MLGATHIDQISIVVVCVCVYVGGGRAAIEMIYTIDMLFYVSFTV